MFFVWFFQFEFNSVFTKCYRPREQKKTPQRIKKDRKKNTQPNWKRNNITMNRSRMFCYQIRNTLYRKRIGNIASGFVCLTQIQFAGNAQLLVCFFLSFNWYDDLRVSYYWLSYPRYVQLFFFFSHFFIPFDCILIYLAKWIREEKKRIREKRQTALHIMVSVSFCEKLFFNRMPNWFSCAHARTSFQYFFSLFFFWKKKSFYWWDQIGFGVFLAQNVVNYMPSSFLICMLRNNASNEKKVPKSDSNWRSVSIVLSNIFMFCAIV